MKIARAFALAIAVAVQLTPVSAQERTGSYRSPPMLLLGIDVPLRDASYQLLTHLPDRGRAVYGFGLTRILGTATRISGNAVAGPAASPLADHTGGAMLIATTSVAHQVLADDAFRVDLIGGVQASRNTGSEATRFGVPLALAAHATWSLGSVAFTPIIIGGAAVRWDNRQANREDVRVTAETGSNRVGWHASVGMQFRYHQVWIRPSWSWSKMIDGSGGTFPPDRRTLPDGTVLATPATITPTTQFTLRVGVSH